MAKGYVIASVTVTNEEAYNEYAKASARALSHFGGKALVKAGLCLSLEGETRTRNVVIEFNSFEEAVKYYHSEPYQSARLLRVGAALVNIVAVEGIE